MVSPDSDSSPPQAAAVTVLQEIYGAPSQAGFGSAVFSDRLAPDTSLNAAALQYYRYFVGDRWAQFGEQAWLARWRLVYTRPAAAVPNIVAELQNLADAEALRSTDLILEFIPDPVAGKQALAAVYDDPAVQQLMVYTVGDGAAMSGLLIAGETNEGIAIALIVLLD